MTLSLLAACFALPISLKAVQISLESFYNRIAFPWHLIAAAVLATVAIAFVSIISQTLKVARRNPIERNRTEKKQQYITGTIIIKNETSHD